jgi:hypothetical protein
MNVKHVVFSAGVLIAGLAVTAGGVKAQGPLYDKVIVDLPYTVTINNTVLQPGHYVIRQLDDPGGGSRVLQIFSDNGMKFKTSVMTIPALDNRTPEHTNVILHHYGKDYYFDKIWIQGKNYGYEFPLPPAVKSRQRERMEPYTVAATYEPTNQSGQTVANNNSSVNSAPATPAPAPAPSTAASSTTQEQTTVAQNTPPQAVPDNSNNNNNNNTSSSSNTRTMPHTNGNWLAMLLSGGMLSSAGMLLRRR